MKKGFQILFPSVFLLMLLLLAGYYLFLAPKEKSYSETENRYLSGVPDFKEALSGQNLDSECESYLLDRFPKRDAVITVANKLNAKLSIATFGDYMLVNDGAVDPLDAGADYEVTQKALDALLKDLTAQASKAPEEPTETPVSPSGEPAVSPSEAPEAEPSPLPTVSPSAEPSENPPIVPKEPADPLDYAEKLSAYMLVDERKTSFGTYTRDSVLALTAMLDQYAEVLPEGGKLMATVVPQSTYANQFVNSNHNGTMKQDYIEVMNAFSRDNVYVFDAAEILTEPIKNDEYVYFRTDMHWTPLGSYYVYKEMVERAGLPAADYMTDYVHTTEEPFLGTYYRDNPTEYFENHADSLELLEPPFAHTLYRADGVDSFHEIPYLKQDAKKNDRYTVYLGGPAGPWTYVECDNGKEENALVLMDSFGLGYFTFLTQNYKQVHYYDPRYYDYDTVGYTVYEMIEKYNIRDIYVVIGDLHSFNSGFMFRDFIAGR